MSKHLYQESLRKLHADLKTVRSDHAPAQKAVGELSANVLSILDHPGDVPFIKHHNLLNDLKKYAGLFEAHHPALTAAIHNVMNTLSNMGI
jgi:hypothetical protein